MLTKLTYGYLILTTAAPIASLLTDYAPVAIIAIAALHWIVIPRILKCARRLGLDQGYDQGLERAEQILTAELQYQVTTNDAHAGALAE